MKVEELEKYGAGLVMPKEAVKKQSKIMFRALRKRFGFWGMMGIFMAVSYTHLRAHETT